MILQPQHTHQQTPPKIEHPPQPKSVEQQLLPQPPKPQKKQSSSTPPAILTTLLHNSAQMLTEKGGNQIKQMLKYSEQKVHLSFSNGTNDYLNHLIAKNKSQNQNALTQIIDIENWLAANKIQQGTLQLHEKSDIKTLKNDLKGKIAEMKKGIMSLSSIERKASAEFQNILQFKKKNYWEHQTERGKNVKTFISKMKRIHSDHKKRQQKQLIQREYKIQIEIQKQKKSKQQIRKEIYSKQLQKQGLLRKQRMKNSEEEKKKKEQIQAMLQKFNALKPYYMRKQQQFTKKFLQPLEEQRGKKLQQIRSHHQPFDQQQLQQHLQRYQEHKDNLLEQHRKKHEEETQMSYKLEQQLKELYHCKFHKDIEPRFYSSLKQQRQQKVKKVKDYQKEVIQHHKPTVDPMKKSKLQSQILDLHLKQNKNKRKIVQQDGSVLIEDRPQFNARRIGVQYLQQLKEDNEGKPRKKEDRSASMMELSQSTKVKRIDYLRQNKPNIKLKKTIGEWKKVMADNSYSPREKYQSIMQQAQVLQQKAHQKQMQGRSYKKGDRAMQLKQQMDMLYLQSVAAKMVVLKDVILKQ